MRRGRATERRSRSPGSVASAVARWLTHEVPVRRNAKGVALARARAARYLLPRLGRRALDRLTRDDIRRYRVWLDGRGLASMTVRHVLSDLRAFLLWAESECLLERSPLPRRVFPRIEERAPRGLLEHEVARLVALPDPWGRVVRLLLGSGLRWAEACRLQRHDLVHGALVVSRTKSGRVRRVPLRKELAQELERCRERWVPFAEGSPGSFSRVVRRRSGLADFSPHRCRHTYAMVWLAAGGSLAVLQELLGHKELSTTMRYARVTDEIVAREVARIAQVSATPPS